MNRLVWLCINILKIYSLQLQNFVYGIIIDYINEVWRSHKLPIIYVGGEMERYEKVLISENLISSATAMILNYSDRTK